MPPRRLVSCLAVLLAACAAGAGLAAAADTGPGVLLKLRKPLPAIDYAAAPGAPAIDGTLARAPFVVEGGRSAREVALTFDDGPSAWTPKIARILRRAHAGGTFFEIGQEFAHFPPNARLLARGGFTVGDHTLTHPVLAHHPRGAQWQEIATQAYEISRHGLPFPRIFRPPYGSFNADTLTVLSGLHMLMVLWSADSLDYTTPGVGVIVRNALAGVHPGSIILFHDGGGNRSQTVQALPRIIRRLKARGYRLVGVPQMLREDPPSLPQKVPDGMGPAATAN